MNIQLPPFEKWPIRFLLASDQPWAMEIILQRYLEAEKHPQHKNGKKITNPVIREICGRNQAGITLYRLKNFEHRTSNVEHPTGGLESLEPALQERNIPAQGNALRDLSQDLDKIEKFKKILNKYRLRELALVANRKLALQELDKRASSFNAQIQNCESAKNEASSASHDEKNTSAPQNFRGKRNEVKTPNLELPQGSNSKLINSSTPKQREVLSPIIIKGAATALLYYPEESMRIAGDIDAIIPQSQLESFSGKEISSQQKKLLDAGSLTLHNMLVELHWCLNANSQWGRYETLKPYTTKLGGTTSVSSSIGKQHDNRGNETSSSIELNNPLHESAESVPTLRDESSSNSKPINSSTPKLNNDLRPSTFDNLTFLSNELNFIIALSHLTRHFAQMPNDLIDLSLMLSANKNTNVESAYLGLNEPLSESTESVPTLRDEANSNSIPKDSSLITHHSSLQLDWAFISTYIKENRLIGQCLPALLLLNEISPLPASFLKKLERSAGKRLLKKVYQATEYFFQTNQSVFIERKLFSALTGKSFLKDAIERFFGTPEVTKKQIPGITGKKDFSRVRFYYFHLLYFPLRRIVRSIGKNLWKGSN